MDAVWNDVEVDFGGDETCNFGPRMETGSALYQVDTNATISSEGSNQVDKVPAVCGFVTEGTVCISTNQQLALFQESCHKFLLTLSLEHVVDSVACDEDGAFVVHGTRDGYVHFLDVLTQQSLFSRNLVSETDAEVPCFHHISFTPLSTDGISELCVVSSHSVFIFSNIQVTLLNEALEENNAEKLMCIKSAIKLEVIETSDVHTECCLEAILCDGDMLITCGKGEHVLCVWERSEDGMFSQLAVIPDYFIEGAAIKQGFLTGCGRSLLTLDTQGVLILWDIHTLTMIRQWDDMKVKQFQMLESGGANGSGASVKLVLLVEGENCTKVMVCELSSLEPIYTLELSPHVFLLRSYPHEECVMLIEGVDETGSQSGGISCLRVRCLTEAQPETRLGRILRKKQFQEAENFAKLFDLDVELVYHVKANHLLEELSPWSNSKTRSAEDTVQLLEQLKQCLHQISDVSQVVHCCISATPPTLPATLELLNIAKDRLTVKGKGTDLDVAKNQVLLNQVLEALHRLATFQVAFGARKFECSNKMITSNHMSYSQGTLQGRYQEGASECGEKWANFLKTNLLKFFLSRLSRGNTKVAFSIWRQHHAEFEEKFNSDTLERVLSAIPEQICCEDLCPWLADDVIPYVIRVFPEGLHQVAAWLEQYVRNLEILEKSGWPQNALEMSELLGNTCRSVSEANTERGLATPKEFATQTCNLSVGYSQILAAQQGEGESNAFVRLHTLGLHLGDLVSLHTNYNCKLSLADYLKETTESLTYRMLDRVVALELISATIEKVVRPYMKEHNLNEECMLFQYIGDLAEREGKMVAVMGEAPWEAKAIAVISCIREPEFKLRAILDAIQLAYIPWSADMEALVQEGLALKHPRVEELKQKKKLVELRQMLTLYDLRHCILDNINAETIVHYILCQDRPTAMTDALQVMQVFVELSPCKLYVFRAKYLIAHGRLSEALTLLRDLPHKEASEFGRRVVFYTLALQHNSVVFDPETAHKELQLFTEAACHILRLLVNVTQDESEVEMYKMMLDIMKKIYSLQVEFNEYVSYYDYRKEAHREDLLRRHIQYFYTHQNQSCDLSYDPERKPPKSQICNLARLYRLGDLLTVSRDILRGKLALLAASSGKVAVAAQLARELFEDLPGPESAEVLYKVALTFSRHLAEDTLPESCDITKLPEIISEFADQALIWCQPEMLVDCLELSQGARRAHDVCRQCETGDYGNTLQKTEEERSSSGLRRGSTSERYKEWKFEPLFSEDGLVMESDVAIPAVFRYNMACVDTGALMCDDSDVLATQRLMFASQEVVQYLRENNQMELALSFGVDAMRVCLLNLTLHEMGFTIKDSRVSELLNKEWELAKVFFSTGIRVMKELIVTLLQKIFQQRRVDSSLVLGYLLSLPQQEALEELQKITQRAGHSYKKVLEVSRVGGKLAELCKQSKVKVACEELETNALWGDKLANLKISFKEAFTGGNASKENLLPALTKTEGVDIYMIREYCRDFQLNQDKAMFMYIKNLLNPSTRHSGGDTSEESDSVSVKLMPASVAIGYIECQDFLQEKLTALVNQIDMYDYECLHFVLHEQSRLGASPVTEKGLCLLDYISPYKRVAPPSQYEVNYREGSDEDQLYGGPVLSPLSKVRLPLHPLVWGEPWKIITPELNANTVSLWVKVAETLGLSQDQVYVITIRNIVQAHITSGLASQGSSKTSAAHMALDKSKCNWREDSIDHAFFEQVMSLLLKVNSCELAVACTGYVVKELPMGAEKVAALRASMNLTQMWMEACAENSPERERAKEAFVRFSDINRRLSTEQVLFRYNLGEEDLLNLSNQPAKLIFSLYEHPSIIRRRAGSRILDKLPDIHQAVDEIATINKTNKGKIQMLLMEQWLPPTHQSAPQEDLDTTMNMTLNPGLDCTVRSQEEVSQDDINLKRLVYLLQHGNLDNNALFLLASAHTTDNTKVTHMSRVRALRCLFTLVDSPTIERMTQKYTGDIKSLLQTLLYLVEFEQLHVSQSIQSFQSCNKEGLVKGLWRNHSHQQRAVRLAADICLDYEIYDVQLWNSLLQQLLAFQKVKYLCHVLVCVSGIPDLWQVSCMQRVWKAVLLHPMTSAVPPLSSSQVDDCTKAVRLMLRCPLLLDLELSLFYTHLCRLELPELAFCCALLNPQVSVKQKQLDQLLSDGGHMVFLQKINEWAERGRSLPLSQQIQSRVYDYIDNDSVYSSVVNSTFIHDITLYLVNNNRIDNLLLYTVSNNRLPEALELVSLYTRTHPDTSFSQATHHLEPLLKLRRYCEEKGLISIVEEYLPAVTDDNDNSKQSLNDSSLEQEVSFEEESG